MRRASVWRSFASHVGAATFFAGGDPRGRNHQPRRIAMPMTLELADWVHENFAACQLGDKRRTARLLMLAQQMAERPGASTPDQTKAWKDLKAAYRLIDCPDVTFHAVAGPHYELTRRRAADKTVLVLGDTTEIDFGHTRKATGLSRVGNGSGLGFLLHSGLFVDRETREIIGLGGQEVWYRQPRPKGENTYQRSQREDKESEIWSRLIERIGPPPAGTTYLHVYDRGADNLDVFAQLLECGGEWVIRVSNPRRLVDELSADDSPASEAQPRRALEDVLARQVVLGRYEQKVRAQGNVAARVATLEVRAVKVFLPPTGRRRSGRQKRMEFEGLAQWAVEAREVDPPDGVEALRWGLWSSRAVVTFDDAFGVIADYEQRWLIEEFHKALKTGCGVENRQHQTAARLEVTTALCGVLAVRLVQLKTVARNAPETRADRVVPKLWLDMLRSLRSKPIVTVRDFYHHLAGLGGFLMRKGDGEPGWITLWKGTKELVAAIRGYLAMQRGQLAMQKRCG
jgi:hypothetical protein